MAIDKILDRFVNLSLIVVCTPVGLRFGQNLFTKQPGSDAPIHSREDLRGVSLSDARPTKDNGGVLLFVSPSCPFCERSLPYYRSLSRTLRDSKMSMLVTLVDKGDESTGEEYVKTRHLPEAVPINNLLLQKLNIRATPTAVVYDGSGRITDVWAGMLTGRREEELQNSLPRAGRP